MPNTDNLCMHCMHPVGDEEICPHCHFKVNEPQYPPYLPIRAVLVNSTSRYLVGNVIDKNGDGVTYIGWDLTNRVAVKIREFLPDGIAQRDVNTLALNPSAGNEQIYNDCYQSFRELWRSLMRYNGLSCLIKVNDVFEYNNTVYAVYEHSEDITLRDYLLTLNNGQGGNIEWERARQLFMPLLSTLNTLHTAGILHRGISPQTLLVGADGKLKLSGFSIWQARTERNELKAELYSGYAAIEQYGFEGQQGTWTDVYALAAVIYRALIGSDPIIATERVINDKLMIPAQIAENLPAYVINALVNALQILPDDRTRNIEQFRAEFSASPTATYAGEIHSMNSQANTNVPYNANETYQYANQSSAPAQKEPMNPTLKAFLISTGAVIGTGLIIVIILFSTVFRDKIAQGDDDTVDPTASVSESATVETVVVKDFTNQSYKSIINNPVNQEDFTFEIKEDFSDTVKEGYVISQSISPQEEVEKGEKIVLTISKGKEPVELPNVIGMTYDEAKAKLDEAGFICTVTGGNKEGVVVSMSLEPLKKYEKGKPVELTFAPQEEATMAPQEDETQQSSGNGILGGLGGLFN